MPKVSVWSYLLALTALAVGAGPAVGGTVAEYYFNGTATFVASTGDLSLSDSTIFESAGLPPNWSVIPTTSPGSNVPGSEVNMSMQLVAGSVIDTGSFTVAGFNANPANPEVSLYLGNGSGGTNPSAVLTGTLSSIELVGQDGVNQGVLTAYLHPNGGTAFSYFSDPSDVIALNFDLTTNFGAAMYDGPFGGQINGQVQSTSTVPLPAACWLFGSGAAGLVAIARRRRAQRSDRIHSSGDSDA